LPSGASNQHLKQPALLCGGLLLKQLACLARQTQRIDGLLDRRWRRLLNILNLAHQALLLMAPLGGALVEELAGDATVELGPDRVLTSDRTRPG